MYMDDDAKIDLAAKVVLNKYKKAFEALAQTKEQNEQRISTLCHFERSEKSQIKKLHIAYNKSSEKIKNGH